ncbi:uncharacterized protein LOC110755572 [Prunus avium]|uniref:Uncharacterized protein LOC110755572 n=1 Tax=Prunus avium TaxID=42229 RepID=A0A6P5SFZ1_PRUAV|nr:uncharacterized protein LOC110755572 [Prunus avium]
MEPSLEEGGVTIPSRTIAEIIIHVRARVADIMWLVYVFVPKIHVQLVQIIVDVLAFVPKVVRWYFDFGDSYYHRAREEKGILCCIFFSSLTRKYAFIISCIAVSIDPLFFYIPVIDEENKCLGIDKKLKTAALWLRALPDAAFALHTINHVFTFQSSIIRTCDVFYFFRILFVSFTMSLIGAFLILPIPQLAIVVFFFKSGGHFSQTVTIVNVFLVMHYLSRVFLIYRFSDYLKYKTKPRVQAAFNFFFYVLASHVFGGFWYFFSIQREISCLHQSCKNAISCGATDYCSGSTSSRNITFLNELCPSNPPNATVFNFGIFLDAIQYGTTRSMHFPTKFFYCIWWGVRNLSNFGTNMQTSSYVWENCFAIIVSLIGLLLFLYLLGNLQVYMQQALTRSLAKEELGREKEKEIQMCMKMHGMSDVSVRFYLGNIKKKELDKNIDGEVNGIYIISVVDGFWRGIMRNSICWEMLKKVKELQNLNNEALEMICAYLKPKIFKENEMVVEAGQPLNAMVIIIAGSMQAYQPIRVAGEACPSTSFETLDKGMFVGEQLLDWVAKTKTFEDQPVSFKTVRCSKKVEAFALTVDDLKTLVRSEDIFSMKSKVGILKIAANPKIREKLEAIFLWMTLNGISDDLALVTMRHISRDKLKENIHVEVDVNYIFSVLGQHRKDIMRRHFFMKMLKKVKELQHMNDRALGKICDYLKPKVFEENAKVVEVGEPLNAMLYIIAGSMQAYLPITDAGEAAPSTSFDTPEKGMFVGEQLLYWAMKTKAFDDQPASFKTIRCTKKVEAFALTVDDLKTLALSGDIFPMKFKVRLLKIAAQPKISEKLEVIFLWMAINGISDDAALDIMHGISQNKLEENIDAEVDVNYIFYVLDEYGKSIMRRHFCRETLKKVKELQNMNDQALGTICDYLKPKMFEENAQVVEGGEPLNTMLIIISGSMQAYLPIRDAGEAGDARPSTSFETLEKGMFVGEQFLDWAAKTKTFDDQPVSFKTIRCYQKVEAFALTVDDLKNLVLSGDIFPMKSKVGILKIAADPKIREKLEAIFLWMEINGISDDVALDIMHGFSQNKLKENIDAEVDLNYIFSVLDECGRSIMRCHFCMETLKKVKELRNMNDQALGMICDYLKPKMFKQNAQVVEAGQPLNVMLYIVAGSMQTYLPIRAAGEARPSTSFETLEKGMFFGGQLLDWAAKTKNFYDQPVSFKTVQCTEKVEAFALTVDDLKTLVVSRDIFQRSLKSEV